MTAGKRVAVVMFNLGGPDSPAAIRPFLFNLFNDPAIIGAPQPLRWCLAGVISTRRAPVAREIYACLGGNSPILAHTRDQAAALEVELGDLGDVRVIIAMRHWHPMSEEAAAEVKVFDPDQIVLLPLYPQFSTTTTASSLAAWRAAASKVGLSAPSRAICCYPTDAAFVAAHAGMIRPALVEAGHAGAPRLLFSAHGLPERVVARGDPYVWQVERSAEAVAGALGVPGLEWRVCYQSRIGPLAWIGPPTDAEIERAGRDGVPVVVAPISFVSEHSETLVELDVEYRSLAAAKRVPAYVRVAALGCDRMFVAALAGIVRRALDGPERVCSAGGGRLCPQRFGLCPLGRSRGDA